MEAAFIQKSEAKKKSQSVPQATDEASLSPEHELGATTGIPLFLQRASVSSSSSPSPSEEDMKPQSLIQAKLVVGQPGDAYEEEADRVAAAAQAGTGTPPVGQFVEDERVQRMCQDCEDEQLHNPEDEEEPQKRVQRKPLPGVTSTPSLSSSVAVPDSGSPLSQEVRASVEPILGVDLSPVKVHTSPSAQETAKALNAKAFTHQHHIWLGPNQSPDDVELMAHEATHVVQQTAAGNSPVVQRRADNTQTVEDGAEVRRRLQQRMDEALGERSHVPSSSTPTPGNSGAAPMTATAPTPVTSEAAQAAQRVNRSELTAKTAELQPDARPSIDRAAEQQPQVEQAAKTTEESLDQPSQQKTEAGGEAAAKASVGGQKAGAEKAAAAAADQAASVADQAFSLADAQVMPDQPAEVVPPTPVASVDAGGMPLPGNPEMDEHLFELATQAQELREQGQNQRTHATEGTTNTQILRGNLRLVHQSVGQSESSMQTAQGHLEFRRGLLSQARQALTVSEQKATHLSQQAPGGVAEAARGKEKSTPLASESRDLVGQNNANTPNDPEAAQKSQEQGGKLNQVSSDATSIDDTLTQVHTASNTLVQDAAHATQVNTQTRGRVDGMEATLQQTDARLGEMQEHNSQARSQLDALQEQPALLQTEASGMDAEGQDMIATSLDIENRIHQAQQNHAAGLQAVPAVERPREQTLATSAEESSLEPAIAEPPEITEPEIAPVAESTMAATEEVGTAPREDVVIQRQVAATAEASQAEAATPQPSNINIARGLPSWLTGEPEPNAADRQAAQEREEARRQQEIEEINAIARERGGFDRLSAAERRRIAFRLSMRNTFGGISNISWPGLGGIARGAGHLAAGLIDPRAPLMGVVSGVNMIVNGVVNFGRQPSWIGALRLAANVATGLTIILGSITALAGVIAAIMTAITILSLGTAAPITGPIIAFCATIMTTVGGWTFWVGLIAAALQALTFVADLWQAGTAQTADQLQQQSETMTEDARNAGNALLQAGMGRLAQVGGRQMQSAIAEAGGGVAFARAMGRGSPLAQAARVAQRVPGSRVGAFGRAGVFFRALGRSTSRGVRGMFRGLRSGVQEAGGIRSFVGRELRQFGRDLRTGTPKVFRDRRAFSREFLFGDGRPVPPGALREGVLGEMQSAGRNLRQIVEGGHPTPRTDVEPSVPRDREAPAPRREEGVADISEAPPESAPTREASVRDSGHIESDQLSSQQLRNEVEHINNHPELVEGTPPKRTARIGEHQWHEQPGGRWCRHSSPSRGVCVFGSDAPTPTELDRTIDRWYQDHSDLEEFPVDPFNDPHARPSTPEELRAMEDARAAIQGLDRPDPNRIVRRRPSEPMTAPEDPSTLVFSHELKPNKTTDVTALATDIRAQMNGINRIIEEEGMAGLKQRIRNYMSDRTIEAEGRAYVRSLRPAGTSPTGEPLAHPHIPDMGLGGSPRDVGLPVLLRNNSIIGANVPRVRIAILNLSNDVTRLDWILELVGRT